MWIRTWVLLSLSQNNMPITKHIIVRGKVQNVGFRHFAITRANQIGITGWVKNLPDRSVEAVIQGDTKNIELMQKFLSEGPNFSRVSDLTIDTIDSEDFDDFSVRY